MMRYIPPVSHVEQIAKYILDKCLKEPETHLEHENAVKINVENVKMLNVTSLLYAD